MSENLQTSQDCLYLKQNKTKPREVILLQFQLYNTEYDSLTA